MYEQKGEENANGIFKGYRQVEERDTYHLETTISGSVKSGHLIVPIDRTVD